MSLSSDSVVLASLVRFESSNVAPAVIVRAEVVKSFAVVGAVAIVVVFSSDMLSSAVLFGTEEDGVVGEVRG